MTHMIFLDETPQNYIREDKRNDEGEIIIPEHLKQYITSLMSIGTVSIIPEAITYASSLRI